MTIILLTDAISANIPDKWRELRNSKNHLKTLIDNDKTEYLKDKFKDKRNSWKTLQDFNGAQKPHPPFRLIYNGKITSSPNKIANIQNKHFIDKIIKMREKFVPPNFDPIKILENLETKKPKNV